jgi:hypothetical protein
MLDVISDLFPSDTGLARVRAILDSCRDHGRDVVATTLSREAEVQDLAVTWLATPDWTASRVFFDTHPDLRDDPVVAWLADRTGNAEIRRHLAILAIAGRTDPDTAYDVVLHPQAADPLVTRAIREGDPDLLLALTWANPDSIDLPVTGPLLRTALALLSDEVDDAESAIEEAIGQGTPNQRKAASIDLRRLGQARPDLAPIVIDLADRLALSGN